MVVWTVEYVYSMYEGAVDTSTSVARAKEIQSQILINSNRPPYYRHTVIVMAVLELVLF